MSTLSSKPLIYHLLYQLSLVSLDRGWYFLITHTQIKLLVDHHLYIIEPQHPHVYLWAWSQTSVAMITIACVNSTPHFIWH